jgi:hypothetical protein
MSQNKNLMKQKISKVDTATGEIITTSVWYNNPTNYNARQVKRLESNDGISKTIPDEAYTMREILSRFAQGLPLDNIKVPMYHGDEKRVLDLDEFKKMDLSERFDLLESVKAERQRLEKTLNDQAQKQINERKQKQFEQAVENELKKRTQNKQDEKPQQ